MTPGARDPLAGFDLAGPRTAASGPLEASRFQALVRAVCFSGAGMLLVGSAPFLHVGTSPTILDSRLSPPAARLAGGAREPRSPRALALPVAEQAREVMAALALNKKQLAEVLGVSRPTLYAWLGGAEPSRENAVQLLTLLRLMAGAGIGGAEPLNARFVRQPLSEGGPTLLELLGAGPWDEARIAGALGEARRLTGELAARARSHDERLRRLGYEEPSEEERAANLEDNLAPFDPDDA